MIVMLLLSTAVVRHVFYEIFIRSHSVLAGVIFVAVWLHMWPRKLLVPPTIYLLVAACLWVSMHVLRVAHIIYRNLRLSRPFSRATIQLLPDAALVHVKLSRPWSFQAGQYVYLCIPGVSPSALFQSHPFTVFWWYRDRDDNDIIVLIIEPRRGFTGDLVRRVGIEMKAFIDGPYGKELDLGLYGTVLLFASGIGIAAQLPYVKQLLEGYHQCEIKTKRIALIWEMDAECGYRESLESIQDTHK